MASFKKYKVTTRCFQIMSEKNADCLRGEVDFELYFCAEVLIQMTRWYFALEVQKFISDFLIKEIDLKFFKSAFCPPARSSFWFVAGKCLAVKPQQNCRWFTFHQTFGKIIQLN